MHKKTKEERFFEKVERVTESGCWIWIGNCTPQGYGLFYDTDKRLKGAHRVSFEMSKGAIPDGFVIDHLCRVPSCVNPHHLEAVTNAENVNRGICADVHRRIAAEITHCPKGHPYSGGNLYVRPSGNGNRSCKACNRERMREARAEKRNMQPHFGITCK